MVLLKESQVAPMIGMSVHWLRRQRWAGGGIPFIKMSQGEKAAVRYREEDVLAFLNSRLRRNTSDQG